MEESNHEDDDDSVLSELSGLTGVFTDFAKEDKPSKVPLNPPFAPKLAVHAPLEISAVTKAKKRKK